MESSVRSKGSRKREMQPALGRYFSVTGCTRHGFAAALSRLGERSALPGVQLSIYSTEGRSFEYGNLDLLPSNADGARPDATLRYALLL